MNPRHDGLTGILHFNWTPSKGSVEQIPQADPFFRSVCSIVAVDAVFTQEGNPITTFHHCLMHLPNTRANSGGVDETPQNT